MYQINITGISLPICRYTTIRNSLVTLLLAVFTLTTQSAQAQSGVPDELIHYP